MNEEMVTISKAEYDELIERSEWLGWLEAAGVDNWCGVSEAMGLRSAEEQRR